MYRYQTINRSLANPWPSKIFFILFILICAHGTIFAQATEREKPTWWFGVAGAANLNFYGGTTQMLNSGLTVPAAFHKGFGGGIFLAPVIEYHHNAMWGGILQLGYDDRRAAFFDVPCPCGENSTLSATISYISFEPSLRFSPFSDDFYIFGGPRIGYNFSFSKPNEKKYEFTQGTNISSNGQFSNMNSLVYSGQIGIGMDLSVTPQDFKKQVVLSPFISFQPYFGQDPRSVETWALSTVRIGFSIKFGTGKAKPQIESAPLPEVVQRDVQFSVRAPKDVPVKRRVRETFPLRNYVFFEEGSTEIPVRYEILTKEQATNFKEEQLQEVQPKSMEGRSLRQMAVYYNILNIVGDRMKRNPGVTVTLVGASSQGAENGKARAETIKKYLVNTFGIDDARIITEGRDKPKIPSETKGGEKELDLLRAGDQRVDIESTSPEMMIQVGGESHYMIKPVQIIAEVEDPLDSRLIVNVVGANEALASWSLEITDENGKVQRFGPSTEEHINISGNVILGNRSAGDYRVVMLGQTKEGLFVRKDSTIHLVRRDAPKKDVVRFRILYDFDISKTVESYEKFLTEVVTPLIPDSSIVVIHGYTDTIGEEEYNATLSRERVQDSRKILETAISNSGKHGISFETFGFGENPQYASFDNYFPEQRSYNRSVIIDIVTDN